MKIGLVTIHYANSYGGVLQALATQTVLSRFGDVQILDYKTEHLAKTMELIRLGDGPRGLLRAGKDVARLLPRYRLLNQFRSFFDQYYRVTPNITSVEAAVDTTRDFDVLVSGSDQIWNPNVVAGLDPIYYLGFDFGGKRISYASSCGSYRYSERELDKVKGFLQKYEHIAVREKDTADYLSSKLNRSVSQVIDPTLLLDRSEWLHLLSLTRTAEAAASEPYILVYTLKKGDAVRRLVKAVASALKMRVVAIDQDPYLGFPVDRHVNSEGPRSFVELFAKASFVVTNSFHGTAFSVNFGKPFLVAEPESGRNRIVGLLKSLGIEERLVSDCSSVGDLVLADSYRRDDVWNRLGSMRAGSLKYLESALS